MKQIRILYIDDEESILEATKAYLENLDPELKISIVSSAEKALDLIKNDQFEVIVSDFLMPKINGLKLLQEVKNINSQIPFIIFTGKGREEVAIKALNLGADYYLQKGGDIESQFHELRNLIRKLYRKKQTEIKLEKIFEYTGTATCILEDNSIISKCNHKYELLTGYSKAEVEGKLRWTETIHPDDLPKMLHHQERRLKGDPTVPNEYEFSLFDKQGNIKHVRGSVSLIPGTTQKVASLLDITNQKKLEEELRKNEQKYRALFNKMNDAAYLHEITEDNLPGKFIAVNDIACEQLGYTREELLQLSPRDIDDPNYSSVAKKAMQEIVTKGHYMFEMNHITKDGRQLPVEINSHLIEIEDQPCILSIARDISKRKEMEKSLVKREEKYQSLFETSQDGIGVVDLSGNLVDANPALLEMVGYTLEEIKQLTYRDITPKKWHEKEEQIIQEQVLKRGYSDLYEKEYIRKDGEIIPIRIRTWAIGLKNEQPLRLCGVVRDISEIKQTEKQLKTALEKSLKREREIANLFKCTEAVLKYRDFNTIAEIIFMNLKAVIGAKAGYVALLSEDGTENELVFLDSGGLPCSVDPSLPMPIRGLREVAYETGKPVYDNNFQDSQWMKFLPEGHLALPNVLFAPLQLDNKTVGLLGLAFKEGGFTEKDVNTAVVYSEIAAIALKNSQLLEELERSEEKYRSIFEQSRDIIYITTIEGKIVEINQAGEELFGYTQEELLNIDIHQLYLDKKDRLDFQREIAKKGLVKNYELQLQRKDGSKINVLITSSIRKDENGNIIGYQGIMRDITERKKMREAIKKQRDELESFAYTIAHDIRNKLQVIESYNLTDKRKNADKISQQIDEITEFLNQLLLLAKEGEVLGKFERINLNRLIEKLIEKIFEDKEIKTEIKTLPTVKGDPVRLKQAFENLIINIKKHAKASKIKIYHQEQSDEYKIFVEDEGKGITKDKQKEIRQSLVTKNYSNIGLLITQKVIEAHSGSIEFESKEGEGTTFIIHLPKIN